MAPDGKTFYAPPNADFSAIYQSGQQGGLNPFAANTAIGHFGTYDFQRDASNNLFIREYTDASNLAVGIYMNGAGFSFPQTNFIGSLFAQTMSSNAGTPAQPIWWANGWNAANSSFSNVVPVSKPVSSSSEDYSGADGGFVLYPNKSNNNQMKNVYAK